MPNLLPAMRKHRLAKGIMASTVARQIGCSDAMIRKAEIGEHGMGEELLAKYKKAIGWKDAPPRLASKKKPTSKKPNGVAENRLDPAAEIALQALQSAGGDVVLAVGALSVIRANTERAIEYLSPPV